MLYFDAMDTEPSYIPLIAQWEEFIENTASENVEHFATWVLAKPKGEIAATEQVSVNAWPGAYIENTTPVSKKNLLSVQSRYYLHRLCKIAKHASKAVYRKHNVSSIEEYEMSTQLNAIGECSKTQLIEECLLDYTTGNDALKRLITSGNIVERVNELDKREKLVSLTSIGKEHLAMMYNDVAELPDLLVNLGNGERSLFVELLQKLDTFHSEQYEQGLRKVDAK